MVSAHHARSEKLRRDTERERHLAERLKIHRRRLVAVERHVRQQPSGKPSERRQRERLSKHRNQHRNRVETQSAQRGDLVRPRRDRRIHRQNGAKYRRDARQGWDSVSHSADEARHRRGLGGIVLGLTPELDIQLRIARHPVLEGIEGGGRIEACEHRLVGVPAPIHTLDETRIAPNLCFGHRPVCREQSHDAKRQLARLDF